MGAGGLKIASPETFARNIEAFQLLPRPAIHLLALGLPPFEILIGFLLLIGVQMRAAALATILLSAGFAVAIASVLARGLEVDCGCFGESLSGGP